MSQLRLNPLNGRWVTIVAERSERPTDFAPRTLQVETELNRPCPFCPEHTEDREPTLETLDENGNWKMRVVLEDENTLVLCPYWSGMPYELLIIPKSHSAHLTDASTDSLHSMGVAIKRALITLNLALGDVAFNLGFHTAPGHHSGMYHWHVHLWPKLVTTAGFERGTGVLINIVPPEDAALALRNAAAK